MSRKSLLFFVPVVLAILGLMSVGLNATAGEGSYQAKYPWDAESALGVGSYLAAVGYASPHGERIGQPQGAAPDSPSRAEPAEGILTAMGFDSNLERPDIRCLGVFGTGINSVVDTDYALSHASIIRASNQVNQRWTYVTFKGNDFTQKRQDLMNLQTAHPDWGVVVVDPVRLDDAVARLDTWIQDTVKLGHDPMIFIDINKSVPSQLRPIDLSKSTTIEMPAELAAHCSKSFSDANKLLNNKYSLSMMTGHSDATRFCAEGILRANHYGAPFDWCGLESIRSQGQYDKLFPLASPTHICTVQAATGDFWTDRAALRPGGYADTKRNLAMNATAYPGNTYIEIARPEGIGKVFMPGVTHNDPRRLDSVVNFRTTTYLGKENRVGQATLGGIQAYDLSKTLQAKYPKLGANVAGIPTNLVTSPQVFQAVNPSSFTRQRAIDSALDAAERGLAMERAMSTAANRFGQTGKSPLTGGIPPSTMPNLGKAPAPSVALTGSTAFNNTLSNRALQPNTSLPSTTWSTGNLPSTTFVKPVVPSHTWTTTSTSTNTTYKPPKISNVQADIDRTESIVNSSTIGMGTKWKP